jgi:Na+-driven multidrug efflux pump
MIGEILWSLGITVYSGVYAHISTDAIAAVNIASTIEGIAFVPFIALANACAIILGNYIGAGEAQLANRYARRFLAMTAGGALIMGGLMAATISPILTLYNISDLTRLYALRVVTVLSFGLWLKASNATMIVGILRSGGDTRFALFADITPLWTIGVPLALLGGLVLHLPVYWVVLLVFGDEATKFVISISRVLTGRWINNLVQAA